MMTRPQVLERLHRLLVRTASVVREAWRSLSPGLRAGWAVARPVLRTTLEIVIALIIVFEEWGWRPLADLLGRLARWRPWAALEAAIIRLPPYAALLVFLLPTALLLPLKLLAVVLIAKGQVVLAGLLFVAAKVVATALIARLYMLTEPALMQIGWFAWCYDRFMPWKEALTARVRASWAWRVGRLVEERTKRAVASTARGWRPTWLAVRMRLAAAALAARVQARRLLAHIRERRAARRPDL